MVQASADWFETDDLDERDAEDDQQEGYDSEAGEKVKGGGGIGSSYGVRNGARLTKRGRLIRPSRVDATEDWADDHSLENEEEAEGEEGAEEAAAEKEDQESEENDDKDDELVEDVVDVEAEADGVRSPPDTSHEFKGQGIGVTKPSTTQKSTRRIRPLTAKSLEMRRQAIQKTGVIYISRIPPFMKPTKIRSLLSPYGPIDRIFLTPEDPQTHHSRVRSGGNKKRRFIDGWVEFLDKRDAKRVAETLNAQMIGGKKGGYYHDDLWNIKYLTGFKWNHLTEQIANENAERAARLRSEISRTRRLDREFVRNVERSKMLTGMQRKREMKGHRRVLAPDDAAGPLDDELRGQREQEPDLAPQPLIAVTRRPTHFRQKQQVKSKRRINDVDDAREPSESVKRVLSKVF